MSAKEWAVPIALGLVTAGVLWVAVPQSGHEGPHGDGPSSSTPTGDPSTVTGSSGEPLFVFPFAESLGPERALTTFVVVAPAGRAAAERHLNATGQRFAGDDGGTWVKELEWVAGRFALFTMNNTLDGLHSYGEGRQGVRADPEWAFAAWSMPKAKALTDWELEQVPRLGVDGHNGTRITVHVFDETGLLAATNAPANETGGFVGRSSPQQLPGGVWYVGSNATAPPGTRHIPSMARPLFDQLKPLMQGLPAGGVATIRSEAYASVYGVLYVTVRIDGLVEAP